MKYWDDYFDKYGFADGEKVPPDAQEWRLVIVRILNPLLEKHNSLMRLCLLDGAGSHNSLLLLWVSLYELEECVPDEVDRSRFMQAEECFGYAKWKTPEGVNEPDPEASWLLDVALEVYDFNEFDCVKTEVVMTKVVIDPLALEYAIVQIDKEFQNQNKK